MVRCLVMLLFISLFLTIKATPLWAFYDWKPGLDKSKYLSEPFTTSDYWQTLGDMHLKKYGQHHVLHIDLKYVEKCNDLTPRWRADARFQLEDYLGKALKNVNSQIKDTNQVGYFEKLDIENLKIVKSEAIDQTLGLVRAIAKCFNDPGILPYLIYVQHDLKLPNKFVEFQVPIVCDSMQHFISGTVPGSTMLLTALKQAFKHDDQHPILPILKKLNPRMKTTKIAANQQNAFGIDNQPVIQRQFWLDLAPLEIFGLEQLDCVEVEPALPFAANSGQSFGKSRCELRVLYNKMIQRTFDVSYPSKVTWFGQCFGGFDD